MQTIVGLKKWGTLLLMLIGCGAYSQNAIYFDGADDYASVPNASSLIAGANGMALSLWVYPRNTTSGWPDFDGFAGLRNNSDADFYLMQLGPGDVEGRFRNSLGTTYTLSFNNMTMNAWNHFVLTYDGSSLILYHNGTFATSVAASGSISNTSTALDIGYLWFGSASQSFYLKGKLDNVSLWKKGLTFPEVTNLYNACAYDLTDTNMVLCYEFNQGIAGGNNTSITSLIDSKGNINGTLYNLALNDTISNFVNGLTGNVYDTLSATSCDAYTAPSGNAVYTTSGTYHDTLPASNGCDSVLIILLTIDSVDTGVAQTDTSLTANATGVSYQWFDCQTGQTILGATAQTFYPTSSGQYAVIIDNGTCTDTSACKTMHNIGLTEYAQISVKPYPNPTDGLLYLQSPQAWQKAEITDLAGRTLLTSKEPNRPLDLTKLPSGVYLVRVYFENTVAVEKVERE